MKAQPRNVRAEPQSTVGCAPAVASRGKAIGPGRLCMVAMVALRGGRAGYPTMGQETSGIPGSGRAGCSSSVVGLQLFLHMRKLKVPELAPGDTAKKLAA